MADTIKSSAELKLVANFYDGDTRTLTFVNPLADLAASDVKTAEATTKTTQAIIGDKTGAAFVGFGSAKTVTKTQTDLDLTLITT